MGGDSTKTSVLEWTLHNDGKPSYIPAGGATPLTLANSVPAANATGIAAGADPVLTFSNPLLSYSGVSLIKDTDGSSVPFTASLDSTAKVLTLTPSSRPGSQHGL